MAFCAISVNVVFQSSHLIFWIYASNYTSSYSISSIKWGSIEPNSLGWSLLPKDLFAIKTEPKLISFQFFNCRKDGLACGWGYRWHESRPSYIIIHCQVLNISEQETRYILIWFNIAKKWGRNNWPLQSECQNFEMSGSKTWYM